MYFLSVCNVCAYVCGCAHIPDTVSVCVHVHVCIHVFREKKVQGTVLVCLCKLVHVHVCAHTRAGRPRYCTRHQLLQQAGMSGSPSPAH